MRHHHISLVIWMQNLWGFLLSCSVAFIYLKHKPKIAIKPEFIVLTGIFLLGLSFLNDSISDVSRWVSLGPIHLHISFIFLPLIIINLANQIHKGKWKMSFATSILILILLMLQPDASQVTAFSVSVSILICNGLKRSIQYLLFGLLILITIISWYNLDLLQPVSYVEGILELANDMGMIWYLGSILSLIVLILPFFLLKTNKNKHLRYSLGGYFIVCIISSQIGHFPVPILGYGISPFIGYSIALTWLISEYQNQVKLKSP